MTTLTQAWASHGLLPSASPSSLLSLSSLPVVSATPSSSLLVIRLHRQEVIRRVLLGEEVQGERREVVSTAVATSPSLTWSRVQAYCSCLPSLPLTSPVLLTTGGGGDGEGREVRMGVVLGEHGKKEEEVTMDQLVGRVEEVVREEGREREREEGEESGREGARVGHLARAALQFLLLGSPTPGPVRLDQLLATWLPR